MFMLVHELMLMDTDKAASSVEAARLQTVFLWEWKEVFPGDPPRKFAVTGKRRRLVSSRPFEPPPPPPITGPPTHP